MPDTCTMGPTKNSRLPIRSAEGHSRSSDEMNANPMAGTRLIARNDKYAMVDVLVCAGRYGGSVNAR